MISYVFLDVFRVLAISAFRHSNITQEASNIAPRRPKRPPRGPQDGPRRPPNRPRGAQDSPRGLQDCPKRGPKGGIRTNNSSLPLQEAPRTPQEASERPEEPQKRPPRGPKEAPQRPPWRLQKCFQKALQRLPMAFYPQPRHGGGMGPRQPRGIKGPKTNPRVRQDRLPRGRYHHCLIPAPKFFRESMRPRVSKLAPQTDAGDQSEAPRGPKSLPHRAQEAPKSGENREEQDEEEEEQGSSSRKRRRGGGGGG